MVLMITRSRSMPSPTDGVLNALWMCQLTSSPPSSSEPTLDAVCIDELVLAELVDTAAELLCLSFPNLSLPNDFEGCNDLPLGAELGAALAELSPSLRMIRGSAGVTFAYAAAIAAITEHDALLAHVKCLRSGGMQTGAPCASRGTWPAEPVRLSSCTASWSEIAV